MSDEPLETSAPPDDERDQNGGHGAEPLRPRASVPSFVPASAHEGLEDALSALQPSLLPGAPAPGETPSDDIAPADAGASDASDASDAKAAPDGEVAGDAGAAYEPPRPGLTSTILSRGQAYDAGAIAAAHAIARRSARASRPAGAGADAERERAELLEHLAERSRGRRGAEQLYAAAAEQWQRLAEPARATQLFASAHAENPRDLVALRELRKHAVGDGDHAGAAQLCALEAELALDAGERASLLLLRAEIELARGDRAAAEAALGEALRAQPSVSGYLALADLHRGDGHRRQAAIALQQAAELWADPKARAALWLESAGLLEDAGELDDALTALERAERDDPSLIDAALRRARLARARGDTRAALDALGRAAEQLRGDALAEDLARARAALLDATSGNAAEALRLLAAQKHEVGLRLRARLAERAGDFEARRVALEQSAAAGAGAVRVQSLVGLCELHAGRGDLDGAREVLREAALVDRDSPLLRAMQASLLRASDAPAAARFAGDDAETEQVLAAAARAAKDPRAGAHELSLLLRAAQQNRSAELIALDLAIEQRQWPEAAARFAREVERAPSPALRLGMELARRELLEAHEGGASAEPNAPVQDDSALALVHRLNRATRPAEQGALWLALAAEMRGEAAAAFATLAGDLLATSGSGREAYERALAATPGYAAACWSLERMLATPDERPALRRVHAALARTTRDPLERAARELRMAMLARDEASAGDALPPAAAMTTPSDALHCDRTLGVRGQAHGLSLAELLESGGHSAEGPLAAVAKLRAAALHEDLGEPARAAVLYREVLDVSQGSDAHAALGLERALDDAGMTAPLFEHLERSAITLSSVAARRGALEDLASMQAERGLTAHAATTSRTLLELEPQHVGALRARQRDAIERNDLRELAERSERLAERTRDRDERAAQLRLAGRARALLGEAPQLSAADAPLGLWHALATGEDARARAKPAIACASWLELGARMKDPAEQLFCALRAAEALERVSPARAAAALAPHVAAAPQHAVAHEALGRLRQAADDAAGAAHDFEQAAAASASHTRRARLWYRAGVLWQDAIGDDARARRALSAVVAIDVTHQDSFERLRRLLLGAHDAAALSDLLALRVAAGGESSERVALLVERARLLAELGQRDAAKSALTQALALDATHLPALQPLAELYLRDAQWRPAAEALISVARLTRDRDVLRYAFMTLGRIYTEQTPDLRRAEIAYARAGALDPDDTEALERLLYVFRKTGDHDRALRACERLIALSSHDADVDARTIEAAAVLEDMGQPLRAERALNDRREQRPASVAIISALTALYTRQHDTAALHVHLDRSIHGLRTGILRRPTDGAALRELVEVLVLRGRSTAAETAAALAIDLHAADERCQVLGRRSAPLGRAALADAAIARLWPRALPEAQRELLRWLDAKGQAVLPRAAHGPALAQPAQNLRRALALVDAALAPRGVALVGSAAREIVAVQARPLTLAVNEDLAAACDVDALAFLLARAAVVAQLGLGAAASSEPAQLDALFAAASEVNPKPGSAAAALESKLGTRKRIELHDMVQRAGAGGAIDAAAMRAAALHMGARVALLALGKCRAALSALRFAAGETARAGDDAFVSLDPNGEARALLQFALSDAYLERPAQRS
jgi:tetratricopeptide (TPR) repeat protein